MTATLLSGTPLQPRHRALAKTLCYRVLMVLVTVAVAWAIVGDVTDALNIGIATNLLKTATYYGYERLWDHIAWGV